MCCGFNGNFLCFTDDTCIAGILNSSQTQIYVCEREKETRRDIEKCVSVEPEAIQHLGNTCKLQADGQFNTYLDKLRI